MSGPRAHFGRPAAAAPNASPAARTARAPVSSAAAQAAAARRVGARVGRVAMPPGRPAAPVAAPVALVLVPAQAARRRVSDAGQASRGPLAVPVLALAVLALTWVDTGMLRAVEEIVDPAAGTAGDGAEPGYAGLEPLGADEARPGGDDAPEAASDDEVADAADRIGRVGP